MLDLNNYGWDWTCVTMGEYGLWSVDDCDYQMSFVCEISGTAQTADSYSYHNSSDVLNAKMTCQGSGGHLASIHSNAQQAAV